MRGNGIKLTWKPISSIPGGGGGGSAVVRGAIELRLNSDPAPGKQIKIVFYHESFFELHIQTAVMLWVCARFVKALTNWEAEFRQEANPQDYD